MSFEIKITGDSNQFDTIEEVRATLVAAYERLQTMRNGSVIGLRSASFYKEGATITPLYPPQ